MEFPGLDGIKSFQKAQKARILGTYINKDEPVEPATILTKADFDVQYPQDKFERYSLESMQKFREDLIKAETSDKTDEEEKNKAIEKANADFALAIKGLKHFLLTEEGKEAIVFARPKVSGE